MKMISSPAPHWNSIIRDFHNVHLLQTWEWGHAKSQFGWKPNYVLWKQNGRYQLFSESDLTQITTLHDVNNISSEVKAAALILQRRIPIRGFAKRLSILYAPKGPLLDWADGNLCERVFTDLQRIAKDRGAILIKVDPDVSLGTGIPGSPQETSNQQGRSVQKWLENNHWSFSNEQVQFRNTCLIDLTQGEDELLANMKQKTRYNIRLAERKGVDIRHGTQVDIPLLYKLYAETSHRDGFIIRDEIYYRTIWQSFLVNPLETSHTLPSIMPLIAEVEGEPVAAIIVFFFASKAWYLYGMSREVHREKMPNYLLQWEAMRLAKRLGCQVYDLWGAPDVFDNSDSMWGVFRFKEGLGGSVVRHIGAWDYPVQPLLYRLYTHTLPRVLSIMRLRQKSQISRRTG